MSRLPLVLSIALIAAAPAGMAAARNDDVQVKMSTRGVNFADASQVKAFYTRINLAARSACNTDTFTPWGVKEGQACRDQFVSDAVNQVNAPLLTAMNSQDSRKPSTSAYAFGDQ
jgi:UrcA family protein